MELEQLRVEISLIIPIFNVEKYLRKCLDSILSQTFSDFEVICVDDASTDGSWEIIEEYVQKDSRFIGFKQSHAGAGASRNAGIELARGKYIQFLDADDYFEPNMLEELHSRAETYGSDLTVCSSRKVDDEGNITESGNPNSPINLSKTPLERPFNKWDFKEDIFSLMTPVPWNKLYLKSLITTNSIEFPEIDICEDIAFVHACTACANKILVFPQELINYRYNRPGGMATYRTKYTIDVVKSCIVLREFLKSKGLYSELYDAFIKAFKTHIRWEIAQCNDEEYQNFLEEFKKLMPDDWILFESALRKDYITAEYLKNFIGNRKVMLWGASFFIQNILTGEEKKNPNILGIIDKNKASWGKMCGNYKIYPPESLYDLKPDGVVMTIWSNYETIYPELKAEFEKKYPQIELLPNIFEKEIKFV